MGYRILRKLKTPSRNTLWEFHTVEKIITQDDPNGVPNPETGEVRQVETIIIDVFETNDLTILENEVKELLTRNGKDTIKIVNDVSYELDVLMTNEG